MTTTTPAPQSVGRITGEITPQRFLRLTSHLRVNGKPVENILHRLQAEKRGEVVPAESAPR